MGRGRLLALRDYPCIDLVELDLVHLLALDQVGFAGFVDLDLLQHLADNHFNVLVIDAHALEPVDVLDLVDEVAGKLLDAFDRQNIVRRRITLDDEVALLYHIAFLQVDVLAFGNEIFPGLLILVGRFDADATFVFVVAAEAHGAGDFRNHRGFLRPARFEQLRHPRQTAGDVARLGAFGRNTRQDVARPDLGADVHRQDCIDRQHVARITTARQLQDLAVLALDDDRRPQIRPAPRRAPIDDDALGDTGGFVERLRNRLPVDQILEADGAFGLRQHRAGIGIPLGDALAALDHVALVDVHARAVLDAMARTLGAVGVDDRNHHIAHHRD